MNLNFDLIDELFSKMRFPPRKKLEVSFDPRSGRDRVLAYLVGMYRMKWQRAELRLNQLGVHKIYSKQDLHKRSPAIKFTRQIDATIPGPDKVKPYCWGIGTVTFYALGKDGKYILADDQRTYLKVWEERIPEIAWIQLRANNGTASVQWEESFGWVLHVEIWHDAAKEFWKQLDKECYLMDVNA